MMIQFKSGNRRPQRFRVIAIVLSIGLLYSAASAQDYEVTELGTLGGIWSRPSQFGSDGSAAGGSTVYNGALHPFIWSDGIMDDLGVPDDYLVAVATGRNSVGLVVGYANGEYQSQYAYIWDDGQWAYLGTLPGEGLDYSVAADINDLSQVCGYSFTLGPGSRRRGWVWQNGEMTDIGTLGGDKCSADAVNEIGQVVGNSQIYDPDEYIAHAFVWQYGEMTDLGTLPGEVNSAAVDINENCQIVGSCSHRMQTYPFLTVSRPCLWENGEAIDLGLVESYMRGVATAINDNGVIVGWMSTSLSGGNSRAFIRSDSNWIDLNTLVPSDFDNELISALDIDNEGRILCEGTTSNSSIQGFLLTPVSTEAPDEPEATVPGDFIEIGNYPNPFNISSTITIDLPQASFVTLQIFNLSGQLIATLVESELAAGRHQIKWDAENCSSNIYCYRLQAGGAIQTKKMTLLK